MSTEFGVADTGPLNATVILPARAPVDVVEHGAGKDGVGEPGAYGVQLQHLNSVVSAR